MIFSLSRYLHGLGAGRYSPPRLRSPYIRVSRRRFRELERAHDRNGNDVDTALRQIRRRVSPEYRRRLLPVQRRAISYSYSAFPAYRFILPEVIADDWLAIMDWRKYQRDHVIHQPLVAYVLLKMLVGNGGGGGGLALAGVPLLQRCVDAVINGPQTAYLRDYLRRIGVAENDPYLGGTYQVRRRLWESLFVRVAYLSALFHDMGYPWQYIGRLGGRLEHAGQWPGRASAEEVIDKHSDRLLLYPLNGYRPRDAATPATWAKTLADMTRTALNETHGLPGALGFLYLNDVVRDHPRDTRHPVRLFCLEWAAMAIMMHDMSGIYWGDGPRVYPCFPHLRLRFERDPLSSVLTLADLIQDFARPTASFTRTAAAVSVSYPMVCCETSVVFDPGPRRMTITYHFGAAAQAANKRRFLPRDHREFFDARSGYLDLSALGIEEVQLLAAP